MVKITKNIGDLTKIFGNMTNFPVVHVTMLQFLLKSKLIIDGSGTKCKSYCNEDNCNLENNPELCYLSFNTIL